jgi:hypothetical protein
MPAKAGIQKRAAKNLDASFRSLLSGKSVSKIDSFLPCHASMLLAGIQKDLNLLGIWKRNRNDLYNSNV